MDLLSLGDLPSCGADCITAWCSPLIESCLCPNTQPRITPWGDDLANCLYDNCTFAEQISTCGATWTACKVPLHEISLVPLIVVTFLVQLCAFAIRVWAMFTRTGSKLGLDDISITIAFIFLAAFVPVVSLMEHYGFYENVYTGNAQNLQDTTICFFVFKFLYALSMGWTKIAIVFLYFRILEGRKSRIVLWATQAANLLVMISFVIALPNACKPLYSYWAYTYDVPDSTCDDLWDWGGYYTGFNLLLDIWMIIVPVYTISKLQMDKKAKFGVIAMFCLGFATMAMTIARFVQLRRNANTFLADDLKNGVVWSVLEPTTAFVVACIPSIRVVLRSRLPTIARSKISFRRSGLKSGPSQDPISSSSRSAAGYRRAESVTQPGMFNSHGTTFELSPVKPGTNFNPMETEVPSR